MMYIVIHCSCVTNIVKCCCCVHIVTSRVYWIWQRFDETVQATSHYLNQWWLVYRRIYASLGLSELKMSCQYKNSRYKDKTLSRPSYLYNEIPIPGKTVLYWNGALDIPLISQARVDKGQMNTFWHPLTLFEPLAPLNILMNIWNV